MFMKNYNRIAFIIIFVLATIVMIITPVLGQDKPTDSMQIVIEKVRADKKLLVAANMQLTETEAKAFWPVYEQYQNELFILRSRSAKLINDYTEAFKDISDDTARRLLNEYMTIESLGLKLRKAYLPKFRKVLPEKKVIRYYQIENKIQAALYSEIAVRIPLVQ